MSNLQYVLLAMFLYPTTVPLVFLFKEVLVKTLIHQRMLPFNQYIFKVQYTLLRMKIMQLLLLMEVLVKTLILMVQILSQLYLSVML